MTTTTDRPVSRREHSRFPGWLPWLGIGFALVAMVLLTTRDTPYCPEEIGTLPHGLPPPGIDCQGPIVGTWKLVEVEVDGRPLDVSFFDYDLDGVVSTGIFRFRSDGVLSYAVCGGTSTFYQFNDRSIRTGGQTTMFPVGCPEYVNAVSSAVLRGLRGRYVVADDNLTFTSPGVVLTLERL